MDDTDLHKQIIDLIQRAERDAYERGKADAKRELLAFLGAKPSPTTPELPPLSVSPNMVPEGEQERQRAPKGIVPKFVKSVLTRHATPAHGLTPKEILDRAETEYEKMIRPASIRSELRSGRQKGRYREAHGRWFLANDGEEREEAEAPTKEPSASVFD